MTRNFSVGPIPVRWRTLGSGHFKVVNGGGNAAQPQTSWAVTSGLNDVTSNITLQSGPSITGGLTGNGFLVAGPAPMDVASYVILGAGLQYQLELKYILVSQTSVATNTLPAISVTTEFGKISDYAGFSMSGSFETVPEPCTALLAGAALAGLICRRSRRPYRCSVD